MNTVILPVLNEPRISDFIARLGDVLKGLDTPYEIIVVTGDKETQHNTIPRFEEVKHVVSYGDSLERSILLGFSVSSGDRVVVMDADGSHPIEAVTTMFKALDSHEMVAGSRFIGGGGFDMSPFRAFVSYCYRIFGKMLGSGLSDPMTGFFGFQRKLLDGVRFKPVVWKTCFELEYKSKPRLCEVPIVFGKRVAGVSKTNSILGLRLIMDLLVMRFG